MSICKTKPWYLKQKYHSLIRYRSEISLLLEVNSPFFIKYEETYTKRNISKELASLSAKSRKSIRGQCDIRTWVRSLVSFQMPRSTNGLPLLSCLTVVQYDESTWSRTTRNIYRVDRPSLLHLCLLDMKGIKSSSSIQRLDYLDRSSYLSSSHWYSQSQTLNRDDTWVSNLLASNPVSVSTFRLMLQRHFGG